MIALLINPNGNKTSQLVQNSHANSDFAQNGITANIHKFTLYEITAKVSRDGLRGEVRVFRFVFDFN